MELYARLKKSCNRRSGLDHGVSCRTQTPTAAVVVEPVVEPPRLLWNLVVGCRACVWVGGVALCANAAAPCCHAVAPIQKGFARLPLPLPRFLSARGGFESGGDNPPPDIIVDKTAQFVAKVCCASPTTLIRPQQHIHTRQPTLPRKIYFGLTAHPPSATRPQHTQPRTPQLRTYITKSRDYTTITS